MKHVFVVNPFAGKKDSEVFIPVIEEYFRDKAEPYEIVKTEGVGDATEIAKRYRKEDDACIYALGGDGTAFEVLNGLNDGVRMAVIPNGTGNDFYRMISSQKEDIKQVLFDTIEGKNVAVDYGIANNRKYLNSSSMGIDADINELANQIGKKYPIPKSLVYIVAAIRKVLKPNPHFYTIRMGDKVIQQKALLVAVMNGRNYGGGFTPTPMADLQDGLFDVVIANDMKLSRIFVLLPKYMKGTHVGLPEVAFYQASEVTLDSDEPVLYGCDGEPILERHIEYKLVKNGLLLRVPKASALKEEE